MSLAPNVYQFRILCSANTLNAIFMCSQLACDKVKIKRGTSSFYTGQKKLRIKFFRMYFGSYGGLATILHFHMPLMKLRII